MALPGDVKEREYKKFVESPTRPNETAIEVTGILQASPFSPPALADAFTRSVSGNTETIVYRQGGIAGTILKTVKIYYQSAPSTDLLAGELL